MKSGDGTSAMTLIIKRWISQCTWPVTCLSFEMPPLKCRKPATGWRTENQKSSSEAPTACIHHLQSWSQNFLWKWWSTSGIRKWPGQDNSMSLQNGSCMPFRQNFWASWKNPWISWGSTFDLTTEICARVVDAVCGSCRKGSPNCLYIAIVMGEVLPPTVTDRFSFFLSNLRLDYILSYCT